MCNRLEGKAAIVTGAGSGIGRAIALAFAKEGARVLVKELAPHRINVNAVCPGLIRTPLWEGLAGILAQGASLPAGADPKAVFDAAVQQMIPMKTEQTLEDIAMTVVFLASSESDQITGQAINVDGGAELH